MTVKEVWQVSPQSHVFLTWKGQDGLIGLTEYLGGKDWANKSVIKITAKSFPGYKSVLELEVV